MSSFLLISLLSLPILSILIIQGTPKDDLILIKQRSLYCSVIIFLWSLFLWLFFNNTLSFFQFFCNIKWFFSYNLNLMFGIDALSLFFIILTTFLFVVSFLTSWVSIRYKIKNFYILFFCLEFFLILIFSILDIILFYFCFESILIPMFWIIGIWGSRSRKTKASYLFFFYTVISSLLMLIALIYLLLTLHDTSYTSLIIFNFNNNIQKFLWIAFFFSFATKVPMIPFHIWLPEAHVEAPTIGSVLLAGILLKLGIYGFLRFLIPLFSQAHLYFSPFVITLSLISIIYSALTALRQQDLKRIIAYSSISHMNFVILGIFAFNSYGLFGSIFQSLSHGFVSSALFILIGVLYDRYHSRNISHYGGIVQIMPLFSFFFLFFILSNIAFPLTSGFIGEFLLILGIFNSNFPFMINLLSTVGVFLGSLYSLFLTNRIIYGNTKSYIVYAKGDLTFREFILLFILLLPTLFFGLFPNILLQELQLIYLNFVF